MKGYRVSFKKVEVAELEEFEVDLPKENEVLVRVYYTLISAGTEKANLSGAPNTPHKFPQIPGYSSVGVVEKVGKNVNGLKVGDRVFVSNGGHASYNVKRASRVVKIPDNVPFTSAVFTRVASFPLLALRRARVEIGESIVVVGLGMLGLFGVQLAKIAGGLPVIGVGNREIRREKALKLGAKIVYAPDEPELARKIINDTKISGTGGANVVLETSGSIDALTLGLTYTAKWGRVLVNGCNRITDKPIDLYKYVHMKGVSIIGAHDFTRLPYNSAPGNWTALRDYMTILGYMEDGRLNTEEILSEIVSPLECSGVYSRLLNDRTFPLGVIFDWTKVG